MPLGRELDRKREPAFAAPFGELELRRKLVRIVPRPLLGKRQVAWELKDGNALVGRRFDGFWLLGQSRRSAKRDRQSNGKRPPKAYPEIHEKRSFVES
jgi:hypothetical protein